MYAEVDQVESSDSCIVCQLVPPEFQNASFVKSHDPEDESFRKWFFADGWGATAAIFGLVGAVLLLGYVAIAAAAGTGFLLPGLAMPIVGTILLTVGVVIFAARRRERAHYIRVMQHGRTADATVDHAGLHASSSGGRSVGSYGCTYTFPTSGRHVTVDESVTIKMSRELAAGTSVRIRYLADEPARARIVRHRMYL